jgi:hypothetical protein
MMAELDVKPNMVAGTVVTKRIAPNLVESIYSGRMTADLVGVVKNQLRLHLFEGAQLNWLVNLERVTGVELARSEDSSGFYAWFRANGGDRIAVVMTSTVVRMVMSAVAFATGTNVRLFETRAQALEHLQKPAQH